MKFVEVFGGAKIGVVLLPVGLGDEIGLGLLELGSVSVSNQRINTKLNEIIP